MDPTPITSSRSRGLSAALLCLGAAVGAVGAIFTLNVSALLYGPSHVNERYTGVDGAFRGLVEGGYAFLAGGLLFGRVGWLVGQWLRGSGGSGDASGARGVPDRVDWALVLPVTLLWVYLIYASW